MKTIFQMLKIFEGCKTSVLESMLLMLKALTPFVFRFNPSAFCFLHPTFRLPDFSDFLNHIIQKWAVRYSPLSY